MSCIPLRERFPDCTTDVRRLIERQPTNEASAKKGRINSLIHVGVSVSRLVFSPILQIFKTIAKIVVIVVRLLLAACNKKYRAELPKLKLKAIRVLDSLFNIPLCIAINALLVFKHIGGIMKPSLCYRKPTAEEQVLLKAEADFNTVHERYFETLKDPEARRLLKAGNMNDIRTYNNQFADDIQFIRKQTAAGSKKPANGLMSY